VAGGRLRRREGLGLGRRGLTAFPALLAALFLAAGPAGSSGEAKEGTSGRWHFSYAAAPPFRLSVLFRRGPSGDETRLLLAGEGDRLEFLGTQGPRGDDSDEAVVDPDSGERFSRALHLPGGSRPAECAAVREADGCLVFAGTRGRLAAPLSGFVPGPGGDRLRASVRALATERLAAKIASLAPLFRRSVEFDRYGDDFLALVWPELRWKRPRETERPERGPGCAFDASFGHPCTQRELEAEGRRFSASPSRSRSR
jgi:hypothetical protein